MFKDSYASQVFKLDNNGKKFNLRFLAMDKGIISYYKTSPKHFWNLETQKSVDNLRMKVTPKRSVLCSNIRISELEQSDYGRYKILGKLREGDNQFKIEFRKCNYINRRIPPSKWEKTKIWYLKTWSEEIKDGWMETLGTNINKENEISFWNESEIPLAMTNSDWIIDDTTLFQIYSPKKPLYKVKKNKIVPYDFADEFEQLVLESCLQIWYMH